MGDLTKNFSRYEFACPCCGADNISETLVERLQRVRDAIGVAVVVTSGVRCAKRNEAIGGVKGSAHVPVDLRDGDGVVGHGVDIACDSGVMRYRILKHAPKHFQRIGVGKDFIHLDTDTSKPQLVMWDYYK